MDRWGGARAPLMDGRHWIAIVNFCRNCKYNMVALANTFFFFPIIESKTKLGEGLHDLGEKERPTKG